MHLAMITAYFIEHMFGFSQKQKAGLINKPAFLYDRKFLSCSARMCYDTFFIMMSGSKVLNYDACGLFRALHSHNPAQYSHIVGLTSHFYAHIGVGPKVFHPLMSKLMWF